MQSVCHLPSLVLSGICSRSEGRWWISQVIFADLENQRGSSFCRWHAAATQLCLAQGKHSAALDAARTAAPQSEWGRKSNLCSQTLYKNPRAIFPFCSVVAQLKCCDSVLENTRLTQNYFPKGGIQQMAHKLPKRPQRTESALSCFLFAVSHSDKKKKIKEEAGRRIMPLPGSWAVI